MNNWTKISGEELQLGMSIASLKKGELQIKYVKDVSRLNNIIKEVREYIGISEEDRKLYGIFDVNGIEILNILDKENK